MDILNQIINKVDDNNKQEQKPETTFQANFNTNPLKGKFLNNLDDVEENVGNFDIKIFGVGGAGCNVIKHMRNARPWADNVDIFAFNTDVTALRKISNLSNVYLLGKKILRGSGSGGDPYTGKMAVEEDKENIKNTLKGTDILFLVAGLGKGTGSGATPEIARIAKEMGILTVAVVNLPSINSEGNAVYQNALLHLKELKNNVDSITTISNDLIIKNSGDDISFMKAFEKANEQVTNTISEICDMINIATEMNIDYADLKSFFKQSKTFSFTSILLDKEYSETNIKNAICTSLRTSYTDINIDNADKIIVNLKINDSTPPTIINDVTKTFKSITKNNELSLVCGVDYTKNKNIKISSLVSAKEDTNNKKDNIEEDEDFKFDSYKEQTQQRIFSDDENLDSSMDLEKHDNEAIIDPKELETFKTNNYHKTYINKESFFEKEKSDNVEKQETLSSDECVNLITQAMTDVLKTTTLALNTDNKSKNN